MWVFVTSRLTAETAASVLITSAFSERGFSNGRYTSDRTYVKDLKNLVEVQPPSGDLFLIIVICMEMLGDHASFPLPDEIHFDLLHSSGSGRKHH